VLAVLDVMLKVVSVADVLMVVGIAVMIVEIIGVV